VPLRGANTVRFRAVILGNLLTVPIEDSLLYVQPILCRQARGAIPELRRVPVFFNNQLGYAVSLADSIEQVLGRTTTAPSAGSPPAAGSAVGDPGGAGADPPAEAEEYRHAQQALDRHDLGAYQQAIERLGRLIEQARRLTGTPPPPPTTQARKPALTIARRRACSPARSRSRDSSSDRNGASTAPRCRLTPSHADEGGPASR
jgi:uncharacterized protein